MEGRSPATPVSPYTLANDRFKTNLNRNKTRKWVEAKKIDYGGDDWGAEDGFEEEEEAGQGQDTAGDNGSPTEPNPPTALPLQPSRPGRLVGLRSVGQQDSGNTTSRSGSGGSARSLRPSERVAMERQNSGGAGAQGAGQRSVTGPPSLQIHTGVQPQQRPVAQVESAVSTSTSPYSANPQPNFPPRKSSMASRERPSLTVDSSMHPPRTSSRSVSPASGSIASPPPAPSQIVRPSEAQRAVEHQEQEEKKGERGSTVSAVQPSPPQTGGEPSQPLATVAGGKSLYGLDGTMFQPGPPSQTTSNIPPARKAFVGAETKQKPEQSSLPTLSHPSTIDEAVPQEPRKRFSTSPKLPDFNRLSGFGSDFFSSGGGFMSETSSKAPRGLADTASAPTTTHKPNMDPAPAQQLSAEPPAIQQQQIQEPKQPRPFRPSIPGGWVSETASVPSEMPTPFREQDKPGSGPAFHTGADIPPVHSEHTEDPSLKPAPLRTPTPRSVSPTKSDGGRGPSRSSHVSASASDMPPPPLRTTSSPLTNAQGPARDSSNDRDRTPEDEEPEDEAEARKSSEAATAPDAPAPLQPRRPLSVEQLPAEDVRPHPMIKAETMTTTADSSPLKESDVLRDEIMRSLSPARSSNSNLNTFQAESAARESAYLNDVYGDYWTADDTTKDEHENKGNRHEHQAERLGADTDKEKQIPPTASESAVSPAQEPEPSKLDPGRDRFSWEAAGDAGHPSAPAVNPHHALPELPREASGSGSPSDAPQLSPVDSGPMSPLISLPVLNFGREGGGGDEEEEGNGGENQPKDEQDLSRQVTPAGSDGPGHDPAAREPQSPASASGKEVITPGPADYRGSILFSGSEEKIVVMSPTSPMSPMSDMEDAVQPLHVDLPASETTPTDIPLPRSPSPAQEGGGDANKPSSSQQHIASLRQIMSLPTSPERVYKMLEARSELASAPSGLMDWLAQTLATPEHAHGGASFQYAPAGDDVAIFANSSRRPRPSGVPGGAGATAAEASAGPQHGYSGSANLGASGGGSVRIPGASAAQLQLGNLMHGQAGTKGKELLHSAGKMGKGLLSKGKNKLRERKG